MKEYKCRICGKPVPRSRTYCAECHEAYFYLELKCANCLKLFRRRRCRLGKETDPVFCSRECSNHYRRKTGLVTKESIIALRLEGQTYQQIASQIGVSRQRIEQLVSPSPEIAHVIMVKSKGHCAHCGIYVGKAGHIHHKNEATNLETYNDTSNLELLCIACHHFAHRKEIKRHPCPRCGLSTPNHQLFCSLECLSKSKRQDLICPICLKPFSIRMKDWRLMRKGKFHTVCCSRSCRGKQTWRPKPDMAKALKIAIENENGTDTLVER